MLVIDDGSHDQTVAVARKAGASVVSHAKNLGKGAALKTGLAYAREHGFVTAVSLDADGQHPASEAVKLANHPCAEHALVLGVRDLATAGAPKANRFSNQFSNLFVSLFSGRHLRDTQCGLRRYPVSGTLSLECRSDGFAFEAEVLIRAAKAGIDIEQVSINVHDPPEAERVSHFRVSRDPPRIVGRVVHTFLTARRHR
jgi:glycosyltransferase involved in cell wall biosynthesis